MNRCPISLICRVAELDDAAKHYLFVWGNTAPTLPHSVTAKRVDNKAVFLVAFCLGSEGALFMLSVPAEHSLF